jgi:hypothetical protein
MNYELERICTEAVVTLFKYHSVSCLEGLMKSTRNLSQDIRCTVRDSNGAPVEYKSRTLLQNKRLVCMSDN